MSTEFFHLLFQNRKISELLKDSRTGYLRWIKMFASFIGNSYECQFIFLNKACFLRNWCWFFCSPTIQYINLVIFFVSVSVVQITLLSFYSLISCQQTQFGVKFLLQLRQNFYLGYKLTAWISLTVEELESIIYQVFTKCWFH